MRPRIGAISTRFKTARSLIGPVLGAILVVASAAIMVKVPQSSTAPRPSLKHTALSSAVAIDGYDLVGGDGSEYSFTSLSLGSMRGTALNKPVVGAAARPDGLGYWMVASDGGIFTFGDAQYYGSTGGMTLNKPIVGMAATPDGKGYWLVASDGGIFTFGDAQFYGSTGAMVLNKPIVGMASTPDGKGYWLVASDGGIFTFGDAQFYGSTGAMVLNKPIVGMAATPDGKGYWLVASDGGIFTFGDAQFYGSTGAMVLNKPIVGMAATPSGGGYWLVASDGGIFTFGNAPYLGSEGGGSIPAPIVAITPTVTQSLSSPGATGYDVSNWQCPDLPPQAPLYVVEVSGWPFANTTSQQCLSNEVSWGGPQTQLYIFMGDTVPIPPGTSVPPCPGGLAADQCAGWQNGYAQGVYAANLASADGVSSAIWWLDVETASGAWTSDQAENYQTILGAKAALSAMNKIVGVYSTYLQWPEIAGSNATLVGTPLWVANWNTSNASTACSTSPTFGGGELLQVQILVPGSAYDNDVAC